MLVANLFLLLILGGALPTNDGSTVKKPRYNGCKLEVPENARGTDKNIPLILTENFQRMVYPPSGGRPLFVTVRHDEKISLACPGRSFVNFPDTPPFKTMTVTCKNGKFESPPHSVLPAKLRCSGVPQASVSNNQVGFPVDTNKFISLIRVTRAGTNICTYHQVLKYIKYSPTVTRDSRFPEGSCSINGVPPEYYYIRARQVATIGEILGPGVDINNYIVSRGTEKYLAKGHLAPAADFFYPAEVDATNICDNITPQWQAVNNGNWKKVEDYIREIVKNNDKDLTVYTGTLGIATLLGKELYLAPNNQLPVPKYLWKVAHDSSYKAVVFLTLNNPYEGNWNTEKTTPPFSLCDEACDRLTGLNSQTFANVQKGLTVCCYANNRILSLLPNMPAIQNNGILSA